MVTFGGGGGKGSKEGPQLNRCASCNVAPFLEPTMVGDCISSCMEDSIAGQNVILSFCCSQLLDLEGQEELLLLDIP